MFVELVVFFVVKGGFSIEFPNRRVFLNHSNVMSQFPKQRHQTTSMKSVVNLGRYGNYFVSPTTEKVSVGFRTLSKL